MSKGQYYVFEVAGNVVFNYYDHYQIPFPSMLLVVTTITRSLLIVMTITNSLQVHCDRFHRQEQGPHIPGLHEITIQQVSPPFIPHMIVT